VPNITAVSIANPYTPANTMMYAVTVTVSGAYDDADHDAKVGFRTGDGSTCKTDAGWKWSHVERFATSTTKTFILYNFQPGVQYQYMVMVGPPGSAKFECDTLGTPPSLPANLSYLDLDFDGSGGVSTDYVLLDTCDCGAGSGVAVRDYLIAVDTVSQAIVWYLDVAAVASSGGDTLSGWRWQPGNNPPHSARILATVNRRYLYEWDMGGAAKDSKDYGTACTQAAGSDGPCVSHDAFRSPDTGAVYAVSSQVSATGVAGTGWNGLAGCATSRFVNDGYEQFSGAFSSLTSDYYTMSDWSYDPTVDGGPRTPDANQCNSSYWAPYFDPAYPPIDWTHVNSVTTTKPAGTELIDLSFYQWNQVIQVNASTGAINWRLSGNSTYSTLTLAMAGGISGATDFAGQHAVYQTPTYLQMFDNLGESSGSRVLRMSLSGGPPITTATITNSWALVDAALNPLVCPGQGSGVTVPGTSGVNVLAMCADEWTVEELSDSDGTTSAEPPFILELASDPCTMYGPANRDGIYGWYRAFPLENIGEF